MTLHVITANRLIDGLVVYLTEAGTWVEQITESRVARDEAALQDALEAGRASEASNEVVGVYEVEVDGAAIQPVRLRERIRAYGPTTHTDFARAEFPGHFDHADGVEPVRFGDA